MQEDVIHTIEQNKLPEEFKILTLKNYEEVIHTIKTMVIRGAPAIGAIGAYGLAQFIRNEKEDNIRSFFSKIKGE